MNFFACQSDLTRAECKEIISVQENFISCQDSKPMLSLKQDGMTGGYKLTYGIRKIPKEVFFDNMTTEYFDMSYIYHKINHIKNVYKFLGIYDEIKKHLLSIDNNIYNDDLEQKIEEELVYTGHSLFSMLLPDDFEYFCDNGISPDGKPIKIIRGVLLSGTLNKIALGSSSGSLIHHLAKDYGNQRACDFLSHYQTMINHYFLFTFILLIIIIRVYPCSYYMFNLYTFHHFIFYREAKI